MIVIVLLAIVVGLAIPSYRNYVMRTHRTDGSAALLRVRTAQEKFFLQENRYMADADLIARGLNTSEHGYYTIVTGDDPDVAAAPSFLLTATATGSQLQDEDCRTLSINDRGERSALSAGSGDNTERCWR